jgi:hypothetical protein
VVVFLGAGYPGRAERRCTVRRQPPRWVAAS